MTACRGCGCAAPTATHTVMAALEDGDVDAALVAGLLDAEPCPGCTSACTGRLLALRLERGTALAARERYRQRNARLERRAAERRSRARVSAPTAQAMAALPVAASEALKRALQRARKPSQ